MVTPSTRVASPVPDGPRAHRRELRAQGAFAGLVAPAAIGLLALLVLWGSNSAARGIVGLGLAVMAAPALPLFGAPASGGTRLLAGVAASAVLWMTLGWWAARRATRVPVASWPEWRREYRAAAVAVSLGGLAAVVLAGAVLLVLAR